MATVIPTDIQTELTSISDSKDAIKAAIIEQGVDVSSSDPLSSYATKIRSISTSIEVDETLSPSSTNPVQNKAIYSVLANYTTYSSVNESITFGL